MVGITAVAIGEAHGLALRQDGTVVSWGVANRVPAALDNVIAIAAGSWHSLALRADGTVVGWGESGAGQAEPPAGLRGVKALAAGRNHSLALRHDGTVVGWGANVDGQVGVPFGMGRAIAIAAGAWHSLALLEDGTVAAWGHADSDQRHVPYGLVGAIAIAAGEENSSAILADGSVVDWGVDSCFRRGVPADFHDVIHLVYAWRGRLALRRDGTVVADGGMYTRYDLPVGVRDIISIAGSVTADHSSFLVLDDAGHVHVLKSYMTEEMSKEHGIPGFPDQRVPGNSYPALDLPRDLAETDPAPADSPTARPSAVQAEAASTLAAATGIRDAARDFAPLFVSVSRGDIELVRRLLDSGADINTVDSDGDGALRYALGPEDPDIFSLLLENGADPNAASTSASGNPGFYILHAVAEAGWPEGINVLTQHGALVDSRGRGGVTPLMLAAGSGNDSAVEALCGLGAAVDAVDDDGDSVLYYAAHKGHYTTVQTLLAHGAEANPVPAASGHTPLTAAAALASPLGQRPADIPSSDFAKIVVSLLRAGADPTPMYGAGLMLSKGGISKVAPLGQLHQLVGESDHWAVIWVAPDARKGWMTSPGPQRSGPGSGAPDTPRNATPYQDLPAPAVPGSRNGPSSARPTVGSRGEVHTGSVGFAGSTGKMTPISGHANSSKQKGGCYVATAVYGSYDCPEVWVLRRWRDSRLASTAAGRRVIRLYYRVSPGVVRVVGSEPWFSGVVRRPLDRFVARLRSAGYSSLPYSDR